MDETTRQIIDRITIQYDQPTEVRPNKVCTVYYDCTLLTPNELSRLSALALGGANINYDLIIPVSDYSILFAAAIAGSHPVTILKNKEVIGLNPKNKKILLVADVIHSGKEITQGINRVNGLGGDIVALACIIDRSNGNFKYGQLPLFSALQTNLL